MSALANTEEPTDAAHAFGEAATPAPGPHSTDGDLLTWRQAATSGGLPTPTRRRWQFLRAGVVNLWEFDEAEYWLADGRGQFVGQNQSGKSSLMALTTLIMLTGDLDRQYVDTFGQNHKSFRYYVEPTDEPTDRRDTDTKLNRGWAWVEYGRLADDGPKYYTTLLFAEARRGVKDLKRAWVTCDGPQRVRHGLRLLEGQSVKVPADVAEGVPAFNVAGNGTEYAARVGKDLFGFTDADRLDAVIRMLKVLRTPHLGKALNPDWFTEQMREALPAVDQSEIDELAEGWDQLDKLAADRDSAAEALAAVQTYLRRAWAPWADTVLRLHGDDLISANTRFDNVTRSVREDTEALEAANTKLDDARRQLQAAKEALGRDELELDQLQRSTAFKDAVTATRDAEALGRAATAAGKDADAKEAEAKAAAKEETDARATLAADDAAVNDERKRQDTAVQDAADAATRAGLGDEAAQWAASLDTARLDTAVRARVRHVQELRNLRSAADSQRQEADRATEAAAEAHKELRRRTDAVASAEQDLDTARQALSDRLEAWAAALDDDAPTPDLRLTWLDDVFAQTGKPRPREVLAEAMRATWLTPRTKPLTEKAAVAQESARVLKQKAQAADAAADALLLQPDPAPDAPPGWVRRQRPAASDNGAPLWRLLDPADGVGDTNLALLEASLAGAGLLDAWVSPDGAWVADRDGDDAVLATSRSAVQRRQAADDVASVRTLGSLLRVADDAGPLAGAAQQLLDTVVLHVDGTGHTASDAAAFVVGLDGTWRTPVTSGRARSVIGGPALLGAAARAAATERKVAALRAEASQLRQEAQAAERDAAAARHRADLLGRAANQCPRDTEVVRLAQGLIIARGEASRADVNHTRKQAAAEAAETKAANATAAAARHAGTHALPVDGPLEPVDKALDEAGRATSALAIAVLAHANAVDRRDRSMTDVRTAQDRAARLAATARAARRGATEAAERARVAREALSGSEQQLLAKAAKLRTDIATGRDEVEEWHKRVSAEDKTVAAAQEKLKRAADDRVDVEKAREAALKAWWVPVDAGLAAARNLPDVTGRVLTQALAQAQAARRTLQPADWPAPDAADAARLRQDRSTAAWNKAAGKALIDLRTVLESSRGRSVTLLDPDETRDLPAVMLMVDGSGDHVAVTEAIDRLSALVAQLSARHDDKMQQVLVELLSSTFVEHLRDRVGAVAKLISDVNTRLREHPTGANRTTLQLRRIPVPAQRAGYDVLTQLEHGFVDSPGVQDQVRAFLESSIREAQEVARQTGTEWTEHLATLLDYRRWFDVVTDYRVGDSKFVPLTREVHGKDSGGGKVVTLLQPLLATLVALYGEHELSPRPLWLDEAFTGVDEQNRSTMLDLLVDFDLDFLLAGPGQLVAAAQVPSAAVWFVSRSPEPDPGVDLSLMLWAGRTLTEVRVPADRWPDRTSRNSSKDLSGQPDLFTATGSDDGDAPGTWNGSGHGEPVDDDDEDGTATGAGETA